MNIWTSKAAFADTEINGNFFREDREKAKAKNPTDKQVKIDALGILGKII